MLVHNHIISSFFACLFVSSFLVSFSTVSYVSLSLGPPYLKASEKNGGRKHGLKQGPPECVAPGQFAQSTIPVPLICFTSILNM